MGKKKDRCIFVEVYIIEFAVSMEEMREGRKRES